MQIVGSAPCCKSTEKQTIKKRLAQKAKHLRSIEMKGKTTNIERESKKQRERERQRQIKIERERETRTVRKTDTQARRQAEIQTKDRQADRQAGMQGKRRGHAHPNLTGFNLDSLHPQ